VVKPNLWRRFRSLAVWKQVVAWLLVAFVLVVVIGVAAGGGNNKNNAATVTPTTPVTTAEPTTTTVAPTTTTARRVTTPPTTLPATTVPRRSTPPTAAHTTSSACRPGDPLANVYHPDRLLVVKPCMTVSGTVRSVTAEADGDTHFDLALDGSFVSLLKPANYTGQHGWLVAEIVPADKPGCVPGQPPRPASGTYDYGTCTGAGETAPPIGTHVYVTGPYVLDEDHGGWAEIHPVWQVSTTPAPSPSPAPSPPPSPTTIAPVGGVRILSVTSPVPAGSTATLIAQTSPQAACNLSVTLPSGRQSQSQGLGPATADASGRVQWTWRTGSSTNPGTATATVTCGPASATATFQITG
jgi:hypothetical protein